MTKNMNMPILKVIIFTIVGALLGGALWSYRGSHGWGGESGVLNWGFIMCLYLVMITGGNAKTTPAKIAVAAIAMVITTPSWGTLNHQICGYIQSGDTETVSISPVSGIIMMLLLGFGTAGLFGILLGNMFGNCEWSIKQYTTIIIIYYAIFFLCEATIAHPLVRLIQPEAVSTFESGLTDAGIESTARQAFMSHFDKISWAKKIDGGRNYFTEVSVISKAIATAICLLATRFLFADKSSAKTGLVVSIAFAVGITVADIAFLLYDKGIIDGVKIPAWSTWEYFTGFIAGGIIVLWILLNGKTDVLSERTLGVLPPRIHEIFVYLLGFCFIFGFNLIRPFILRFDGFKLAIPCMIAFCVVVAGILLLLGLKNNFDLTVVDIKKYASIGFVVVFAVQTLLYFVAPGIDDGELYGAAFNLNFVGIIDLISAIAATGTGIYFLVK